jgi:hypothetical protein
MSSKRNKNKNKKKNQAKQNNGQKQQPSKPAVRNSLMKRIDLSIEEATLIYELMHDVKVTYMGMTKEEKSKEKVMYMIGLCNGIMKKVEGLVIGKDTGEGKKKDEK